MKSQNFSRELGSAFGSPIGMAQAPVELDGSVGEGGGQILRTSLALSLITGKPFHLRHIRARRSRPGLQPQHLASVRAAAAVGQAALKGASKGSTDLVFEPGPVAAGNYHFAIGTAGATGLVLHTVYLPLALAEGFSTVTIEGGTHVPHSPCFHFLELTWRGYLGLLGLTLDLTMRRPGFYPRGGGLIQASIQPVSQIQALNLAQLTLERKIAGFSAAAGLPEHVRRRQADRARQGLRALDCDVHLVEETWQGGPGSVLGLQVHTGPVPTFFFSLGERGKPAERVADEAVHEVRAFLEADPPAMDGHSADQILLPLALAPGPSRFAVAALTQHTLTNARVICAFVDRTIKCHGQVGEAGVVEVL